MELLINFCHILTDHVTRLIRSEVMAEKEKNFLKNTWFCLNRNRGTVVTLFIDSVY